MAFKFIARRHCKYLIVNIFFILELRRKSSVEICFTFSIFLLLGDNIAAVTYKNIFSNPSNQWLVDCEGVIGTLDQLSCRSKVSYNKNVNFIMVCEWSDTVVHGTGTVTLLIFLLCFKSDFFFVSIKSDFFCFSIVISFLFQKWFLLCFKNDLLAAPILYSPLYELGV